MAAFNRKNRIEQGCFHEQSNMASIFNGPIRDPSRALRRQFLRQAQLLALHLAAERQNFPLSTYK